MFKIILAETDRNYLAQFKKHLQNKELINVRVCNSMNEINAALLEDVNLLIIRYGLESSNSYDTCTVIKEISEKHPSLRVIIADDSFDSSKYFNCFATGAFNCLNYSKNDFLEELDQNIFRIKQLNALKA